MRPIAGKENEVKMDDSAHLSDCEVITESSGDTVIRAARQLRSETEEVDLIKYEQLMSERSHEYGGSAMSTPGSTVSSLESVPRSTSPEVSDDRIAAYLESHPHVIEKWIRERATDENLKNLLGLSPDGSLRLSNKRMSSSHGDGSVVSSQDGGNSPSVNYSYSSRKNSKTSWLSPKRRTRHSGRRKQVEKLTEPELFMELIRDVSTELDIDTLCHKILVNVGHLTNADRASLFLAQGPKHSRYLVAKLFDVTVDSGLEQALSNAQKKDIFLPWGVGIVGHVASTKEIINISDAYQDPRFDASIDRQTGYRTMSVLCMPVCNYDGEVIGVAEIINKKNGSNEFTPQDVEVFRRYLTFCGIGIQNAQLFDMSVQEYKRNQLLLQLARGIFEEQTSLERLVTKIMTESRDLLKCERCAVYLLERLAPDAENEDAKKEIIKQESSEEIDLLQKQEAEKTVFSSTFELRYQNEETKLISMTQAQLSLSPHADLAKYVCYTGQTLNISDVAEWLGAPLEDAGLLTFSVLTIPVFNSDKQILGVAQMINKESGLHFSEKDINTFEAFAIFCGIGIQNTQAYEKACRLMARQQVALECLSYHATAAEVDTERFKVAEIPSSKDFELYSFDFTEMTLNDDETLKCALRMFMDLNLISIFQINYEVMCRWLLSVKKNYRPVKYHNWRHALTVAQTMFAMLKTGKIEFFMDDLEMFGLIVACLCHDLDHRGTNNSFQTKTESPLAILYTTSTMEHHHFDQCVMILSQDTNNIFQSLSAFDYRRVMTVVENAILSTDMAMYFKKKNAFLQLSDGGEFDWQHEEKKKLLCGVMMTACDVSAIAKPWEIQHKVAKLVADEFFEQGDLERLKLNQEPVAMMDREKKDELPKMQVGFIDGICLPLYKALADSFPWVKPLYEGCATNKSHWVRLAEQVDMGLTWIDHEYIENPVERCEAEVTSKIMLNTKPASASSPTKSQANESEEKHKGKRNIGSALRARQLRAGAKRRSVEKRLDRVTDSSKERPPARISSKHSICSTENNEESESSHRSISKLKSRMCAIL